MAVCCLQSRLKATDILSNGDRRADRIIQLNCNRNSVTPSPTEDYANKLRRGMLSLITLHSCGPRELAQQTYEFHECLHVAWNIYRDETNMQTDASPLYLP